MRAIGSTELLRPGLESLGLEFEEALGLLDHQPPDESAERAALVELLAHQGATARLGDDIVPGGHQRAGRALHPGPGRARVDIGDRPNQLRHAGLLDREPSSDSEGGPSRPTSDVTDAVQSGQCSTSLKTSQTSCAGASISMLSSLNMYQMVHADADVGYALGTRLLERFSFSVSGTRR